MELTNKQIIEALSVRKDVGNIDLPVKLSYRLAKNFHKLEHEAEIIAAEEIKLVEKYSDKDEDGNLIPAQNGTYKCARYKEFDTEHKKLMDIITNVEIMLIPINDLLEYNIKANTLENIMFMLEEQE